MVYEHTQGSRYIVMGFSGLSALLMVWIAISGGETSALVTVSLVLILIGITMVAFSRLSVTVDETEIHVRFRWGWPKRRYQLSEIHRVDSVKNSWIYGFGVRLTPYGWMYNVWGLRAVQLNLAKGQAFRIGTDEPEKLIAALEPRIGDRASKTAAEPPDIDLSD